MPTADVPTSLCAGVVGDRDLLDLLRQFTRLEVSGAVQVACGAVKAQVHLRLTRADHQVLARPGMW